jgi:hypothetical protein
MKIQKKVTEIVEERICDICKKTKASHWCACCKRDLCSSCAIFDDRDDGDYPSKFCHHCWSVGDEFRQQQKVLDAIHYNAVEKTEKMWFEKAIVLLKDIGVEVEK